MSKKIQLWLFISIFIVFLFFYFINIAPNSNITQKNILQQLAPQGFAFYSKNPRDETFDFETDSNLQVPNMRLSNILGLKRIGRAQGIELGRIQSEIPKENWMSCSNNRECKNIKKKLKAHVVKKNKNYKSLEKGAYYIYTYSPLSWYFRDFEASSTIDKSIVKVIVE